MNMDYDALRVSFAWFIVHSCGSGRRSALAIIQSLASTMDVKTSALESATLIACNLAIRWL